MASLLVCNDEMNHQASKRLKSGVANFDLALSGSNIDMLLSHLRISMAD